MKKLKILLLVISLALSKTIFSDPIANCIEQSDIKELSYLINPNFNRFGSESKKRYLNLAQQRADESKANLRKIFGLRESMRAISGTIFLGISGTLVWAINRALGDEETLERLDLWDWGSTIGALASSSYLGINQFYKLFTKFDRYRDYEKALAVKSLLNEIPVAETR